MSIPIQFPTNFSDILLEIPICDVKNQNYSQNSEELTPLAIVGGSSVSAMSVTSPTTIHFRTLFAPLQPPQPPLVKMSSSTSSTGVGTLEFTPKLSATKKGKKGAQKRKAAAVSSGDEGESMVPSPITTEPKVAAAATAADEAAAAIKAAAAVKSALTAVKAAAEAAAAVNAASVKAAAKVEEFAGETIVVAGAPAPAKSAKKKSAKKKSSNKKVTKKECESSSESEEEDNKKKKSKKKARDSSSSESEEEDKKKSKKESKKDKKSKHKSKKQKKEVSSDSSDSSDSESTSDKKKRVKKENKMARKERDAKKISKETKKVESESDGDKTESESDSDNKFKKVSKSAKKSKGDKKVKRRKTTIIDQGATFKKYLTRLFSTLKTKEDFVELEDVYLSDFKLLETIKGADSDKDLVPPHHALILREVLTSHGINIRGFTDENQKSVEETNSAGEKIKTKRYSTPLPNGEKRIEEGGSAKVVYIGKEMKLQNKPTGKFSLVKEDQVTVKIPEGVDPVQFQKEKRKLTVVTDTEASSGTSAAASSPEVNLVAPTNPMEVDDVSPPGGKSLF